MERRYPHLCAPITLGRTTFRNRMFSAPMGGTDITNDGCIGPKSATFYELRGKGGEVVVMGGGLAGCECAIHLAMEGKTVRLVEMRGELAPDANVRQRPLMLRRMEELRGNLTIFTDHRALKVTA